MCPYDFLITLFNPDIALENEGNFDFLGWLSLEGKHLVFASCFSMYLH